ncbi:hypothetical protein G9A89_007688 [Geosiphon pyriformis]|nr:hypothetical protein G9A89_007688 [Geosiphon pyriformis]
MKFSIVKETFGVVGYTFLASSLFVTKSLAAPTTKYNQIVVLGDGWSDNGNANALSNQNYPTPPALYYLGHYNDGRAWVEHLANNFQAKLFDYAYYGATSDSSYIQGYASPPPATEYPVPGLLQQAEQFSQFQNTTSLDQTLGVAWLTGQNDYTTDFDADPETVVSVFPRVWQSFYLKGIRNILVPNLPQIYIIPHYRDNLSPAKLDSLRNKIEQHDRLLATAAEDFQKANNDTKMYSFDVAGFFNQILSPRYRNIKDACVQEYTNGTIKKCTYANEYFWFTSTTISAKTSKLLGVESAGYV